ncbi:hypothetical protein RR46_13359 [Papilio xuthus]|uniref:Uncharacterized protein n=1 Tax=Papilio xuthus TaxID=66420 RepID=A0A194PGI1_PAPXU|nr:hypothetical protein RR46_13359 [Papilio xuthus]
MIVFILLPLLVATEWVEITQNYRKEYKPTRYDYTTSKNIYSNQSIVEHQWSKGHVHRINNPNDKRIRTNERIQGNTKRNPYREDFISTEKLERTDIKDQETISQHHYGNQAKMNQRIDNVSRNKQESVTKVFETINSDRPDAKENKLNLNSTIKLFKNVIEKDSVGNIKENIHENATTPCPDFTNKDYKNNSTTQNLSNEDEIKTKTNPMETLIKFLKMVSQTIKHGTRRTFKSKIRYLEDLRDTLMANIEARIDSAFPDDSDDRRRRRSARLESRGHVEFPSSESALMTISFLTFAVFLIKLVLQVIHTYKAKTMMVTPAVVATVGRTVFKKSTHN